MRSNRLSREKSPYLLQHAANPVDWFPWGEDAFAEARRRNKPILLSIGYSTCHWCHVMAHESFENDDIAQVINAHFVAVKVDREERPDIDHIYMTAVTSMTGQGGWPLTVFMTPDGKPFYGGTYFPPYAKWGAPGFKDLLFSVAQAWNNDQGGITTSATEIAHAMANRSDPGPLDPKDGPTYGNILDIAYRQLSGQHDAEYGGFGRSPKFPMGHTISFLLRYHARTGEANALTMAEGALRAMAQGGIHDHLGGGFHRYSTDRLWHVPHFEKMLYDQALLATAYTECYQITGNPAHGWIAKDIMDYVCRDLCRGGAFLCAEDADSPTGGEGHESREGAFYVWTAAEIVNVLGEEQAAVFNTYYGVKHNGNAAHDPHGEFTGQNILFQAEPIPPELDQAMAQARAKLFAHRALRPRPHLDDKVLTDWSGLMIAACAFAGCALGEAKYIDAARQSADFILTHLKDGITLKHRWREGEAAIDGLLDDYAALIYGLCALYEATFEDRYRDEAAALARVMIDRFADASRGGFYMTPEHSALILRPQDVYDGAIPSGNSLAFAALLKVHAMTGDPSFLRHAEGAARRFLPTVAQAPHAYTFFLSALDQLDRGPVEIKVAGAMPQGDIANFRKVVYKHFVPRKVMTCRIGLEPWSVEICKDGTCLPKITDLGALDKAINP